MDLTGIPAYAAVMEGLLPKLSNRKTVPDLMQQAVHAGWEGTTNGKGFYRYDKAALARWKKSWIEFTYDVKALSDKYEKLNRL
jgi:3-hydroxybutyryl-CoA dehydrogenase